MVDLPTWIGCDRLVIAAILGAVSRPRPLPEAFAQGSPPAGRISSLLADGPMLSLSALDDHARDSVSLVTARS